MAEEEIYKYNYDGWIIACKSDKQKQCNNTSTIKRLIQLPLYQ